MDSPRQPKNLYERAGIDDLAEFYRLRYASSELLQADYFDPINRFDIRWARTMWVYDNVHRGATLLDLGCGSGLLALLKRKDVTLFGVDLAHECAAVACRNGYDGGSVADLTRLPFKEASFDYVVSLDVMGHIELDLKDAAIAEMKRVLKPDGVTMHGIECLNHGKRKDYHEMTEEELRRFVEVDGHVGMEPEEQVRRRFAHFFSEVLAEPRYAVCQSAEELLKQADDYDTELCAPDLLEYLRSLSFDERRAFNMAMGYVFQRISDADVKLPPSEYIFLKASNIPSTPSSSFYNAHRDRKDLFPDTVHLTDHLAPNASHTAPGLPGKIVRLDSSQRATFESGWYAAELLPPIARWMGQAGRIRFSANSFSKLTVELTSHMPDLAEHPLRIHFLLNDKFIFEVLLNKNEWRTVEIDVASTHTGLGKDTRQYLLEVRASRTWQPCSTDPASTDTRKLSIAICNVQIGT